MARDPVNYNYFKSKLLNQEYCVHKKTGQIIFQDGTKYTQEEIKLLNKIKNDDSLNNEQKEKLIKDLHQLKNTFDGTIITDEKIEEMRK